MPYKNGLYYPDGKKGRCQCVRDHNTLIDNTIDQCGSGITDEGHNGLCEGCWNTHGEALVSGKIKRQEH
jgi:hypothetical protein